MATPEQHAQTMLANLPEKTGKTLPQWLEIINASSLDKHGKIVSLLKSEYQVTHGFASLIAQMFLKGDQQQESDLIAVQYSKGKEALMPIYEALVQQITALGSDIEIAPKKAYVSIRRKKQFALIQPSTKTRVDLGINLKDVAPTGRLEASGSFNAMVSHRVKLTDANQVDNEVIGYLQQAYENAG